MAYSEALAQRVRQHLAGCKNVEEKKLFGGIGFLLNGNLLVGVRTESLLVRLDPDQSDEALREAHVSEFTIEGRGAMKGWFVVGRAGVESDDQLKDWIQRSMRFVEKMPPK
jgi:TfoX/Sxy family transcriptional regulator of competence genes